LGTILSDGTIVFASENAYYYTTTRIDIGIVEEADGTVTVFLDCEGMLNASKLDLAQLNLVAALLEARHVHCVRDAID
jgi:hypothetical protein